MREIKVFRCSSLLGDTHVLLFTDVVSIARTGQHFRMIYDVKGRFTVHRISAEEAKVLVVFVI